jgi:hypothetical protein
MVSFPVGRSVPVVPADRSVPTDVVEPILVEGLRLSNPRAR